jgi:hypothetical protein
MFKHARFGLGSRAARLKIRFAAVTVLAAALIVPVEASAADPSSPTTPTATVSAADPATPPAATADPKTAPDTIAPDTTVPAGPASPPTGSPAAPPQTPVVQAAATTAADCAVLPLAPYGPAGDAHATGSLTYRQTACYRITAPAGVLVVDNDDTAVQKTVTTADDQIVCAKSAYVSCALPAAGTYTLVLEGNATYAAAYDIAARSYATTDGCLPAVETGFDQPPTTGRFATEDQMDCRLLDAPPGARILVDTADNDTTTGGYRIVGPTGADACASNGYPYGCVLQGTGPYRVISSSIYHYVGAYALRIRQLSDPVGCPEITPHAFGAGASQSAVPCRVLHVPAPGPYRVGAPVLRADGSTLCPAAGVCVFDAAGRYTAFVDGHPKSTTVAFVDMKSTAGCVPTSDQGAVDPVNRGSLAPGAQACLQLPSPAGATLLVAKPVLKVVDATLADTFEVLNADGTAACDGPLTNCRLTGPAPYRLLVSGTAAPYAVSVFRLDQPVGCPELPQDGFGTDTGASARFDASHALRCFTVPANAHAAEELFQFAEVQGSTLDRGVLSVVGGCTTGETRSGAVSCKPAPGAATVVVRGPASDAEFHVVRRDVTAAAAGCVPTATTVGGKPTALTFGSATAAACVRVTGASTDEFRAAVPSGSGVTAAVFGASGAAGSMTGSGCTFPCAFGGASDYRVVTVPTAGAALPAGPVRLSVWRTATAAGPPPECPKLVSQHGFTLTGTVSPDHPADCVVVPVKAQDSFDLTSVDTGTGQARPWPTLLLRGDAKNVCTGSGDQIFRCRIDSTPAQGYALLIVAGTNDATVPYRVEALCRVTQCGSDVLKLTAVSPNTAPRNTTATLTLTGTVLQRTDTVRLTHTGKADLPVTVTGAALDGTSSTGTVNLAGAAFGSWNVVVKSADGTERVLANAFTVVAASRDQLTPQEDGSKWDGTKGRTPIKPS